MSVNIKNREVETLLAEIKRITGKGASGIVLDLLRKETAKLRRQFGVGARRRRIDVLARRYSARLPARPLEPDKIVGYDKSGLPE